jgi:hypothetical protein
MGGTPYYTPSLSIQSRYTCVLGDVGQEIGNVMNKATELPAPPLHFRVGAI